MIQDAKVLADEALIAANNEEREHLRFGAICEYVCPALVKVGELEKVLRIAQGMHNIEYTLLKPVESDK